MPCFKIFYTITLLFKKWSYSWLKTKRNYLIDKWKKRLHERLYKHKSTLSSQIVSSKFPVDDGVTSLWAPLLPGGDGSEVTVLFKPSLSYWARAWWKFADLRMLPVLWSSLTPKASSIEGSMWKGENEGCCGDSPLEGGDVLWASEDFSWLKKVAGRLRRKENSGSSANERSMSESGITGSRNPLIGDELNTKSSGALWRCSGGFIVLGRFRKVVAELLTRFRLDLFDVQTSDLW